MSEARGWLVAVRDTLMRAPQVVEVDASSLVHQQWEHRRGEEMFVVFCRFRDGPPLVAGLHQSYALFTAMEHFERVCDKWSQHLNGVSGCAMWREGQDRIIGDVFGDAEVWVARRLRGARYRFDVEIAAMKTCDLFRLACEAGTRLVLVLDGPIRPQEPYWRRMEAAEEE